MIGFFLELLPLKNQSSMAQHYSVLGWGTWKGRRKHQWFSKSFCQLVDIVFNLIHLSLRNLQQRLVARSCCSWFSFPYVSAFLHLVQETITKQAKPLHCKNQMWNVLVCTVYVCILKCGHLERCKKAENSQIHFSRHVEGCLSWKAGPRHSLAL